MLFFATVLKKENVELKNVFKNFNLAFDLDCLYFLWFVIMLIEERCIKLKNIAFLFFKAM